MTMATPSAPGRSATFSKILVCLTVAAAGLIAGRLSIERPSEDAVAAARRDLSGAEKTIILAAVIGKLPAATIATVDWPLLVLTSREGVSDYCGTAREPGAAVAFYAQLVFPQADPRKSLTGVNFTIVAVPDDPQARYVVGAACLRYGYGAFMPAAP